MPELIRAIDNLAKALVAPVPCPPCHRGGCRDAPGPAQHSRESPKALTAATNRRFVIIQQGNNGLAACIHHQPGPRG